MGAHLPVGPLVELVDKELGTVAERMVRIHAGWHTHGEEVGAVGLKEIVGPTLARYFYRARSRGYVTPSVADRLAVAFGTHPGELWPVEWFSEGIEEL